MATIGDVLTMARSINIPTSPSNVSAFRTAASSMERLAKELGETPALLDGPQRDARQAAEELEAAGRFAQRYRVSARSRRNTTYNSVHARRNGASASGRLADIVRALEALSPSS